MLLQTLEEQKTVASMPERVLILNIAVPVAMDRLADRPSADSFEQRAGLEAVHRRYLRLASLVPECVLVDADGEPHVVMQRLLDAIDG